MSIQSNFPNLKPSLLLDFANTKQLDNRITFTRSTPAVYYDGKTTAMAEQNLLTYSQNSTTNWTVVANTTTSSATTAPDGTSTALSLVPTTATTNEHLFYQAFTGTDQPYTFSIYAKANGYNWVYFRPQIGGSLLYANFNLSTGTLGFISTGITATITSVGNGWYRCTATRTMQSIGCFFVVGVSNADGVPSFAGDGTSGVYIWGAQLEARSTATAYTVTTTQPITNYIPVLLSAGGNQARFDHNPTTGESLGLLIEEQRTNLATYSEQFGSWSVSGFVVAAPSILPNQVIAPDGTLTGDQITLPAVSGVGAFTVIYFPFTASATTYTGSFYLKGKNGGEVVWINFTKNGVTYTQTLCTLTTSWQRFTLTSALTAGSDNFQIGVDLRDSAESAKPAQTFFIWGGQLEVGAFPTSYISTTSASATRTADAAIMTGANFFSWFNAAEGTLFTNFKTVASTNFPQVACMSDGTTQNSITIDAQSGLRAFVTFNGANPAFFSASNSGNDNLVSLGYKVNDFGASFNNAASVTDTSGNVPNVFQMGIGQLYSASNLLNGTIKKIAYYPIKVSSAQIQALTS